MQDVTVLSPSPVYLSARTAIVQPEHALPVTLYAIQKWLPRLGAERWSLIALLRALCVDAPRRVNGTKEVLCNLTEVATALDVSERTVRRWFKHESIPDDAPWRRIIPADDKAKYLSCFIPRLRYAYENGYHKGKRVGLILEIVMDDPVIPEDELRLKRQADLLNRKQGTLPLTPSPPSVDGQNVRLHGTASGQNARSHPDVSGQNDRLHQDVTDQMAQAPSNVNGQNVRSHENVNGQNVRSHENVNGQNVRSHTVESGRTDLSHDVNGQNVRSHPSVNGHFVHSHKNYSDSVNVNQLTFKLNHLDLNLSKPTQKMLEPIVVTTEVLLDDDHSTGFFYKQLRKLYPNQLDLYVDAVEVALSVAERDPEINKGQIFTNTLKKLIHDSKRPQVTIKQPNDQDRPVQAQPIEQPQPAQSQLNFAIFEPQPPQSLEEQIWQETLQHLQQQMPRATFSRIAQATRLLSAEPQYYLIGIDNQPAKNWLEHRLFDTIQRTLSRVAGQPVTLEFQLINHAETDKMGL